MMVSGEDGQASNISPHDDEDDDDVRSTKGVSFSSPQILSWQFL